MAQDVLGRFVWYELMTTDEKAAKDFYTRVVGWTTAPFDAGGMPYTVWMRGEAGIGGVMTLPAEAQQAGAPSHWLAYVATPNVDETFNKAVGLGASVFVKPTDIPTVGRFAVLADPMGAMFCLYTPASPQPSSDEPPAVGQISWHELTTTDHAAAFAFYHALFGWESIGLHDMGPMGFYRVFGRQGQQLGGMFNKPADMPAPPNWLLYIRVDDVNHAVERVKQAGGKVLNGPMEVPGGDWVAQCMDPQGAAFAVHEKKV